MTVLRPEMLRFLWRTAWRDLCASGHSLWIFGACLALGVCLITAAGGLYRQVTGSRLADTGALLGALTVGFAVLIGSAIALPLIELRLRLSAQGLLWTGAVVAISVTTLSLGFGARYLMARLSVRPGTLLRGA